MKCQVGYNLSNMSHGILTCGSNGQWQGTMGTCNGKNNLPNATQIVQRLQFANLKAKLRPQETSLSTFCFLPLCHFFSGPRISLLSQNQFAATRTLSACEQALRFGGNGFVKSRGEGEGKNGMGSFRFTPPPLPPTSIFFASNFFLSYPSMEPNPSLTHFVGMKNVRQALLASCLSAC